MAELLERIDDILYTWCLIYLLAGAGIYFTVKTRFAQIRLFKESMRCMLEKKQAEGGVSSFQALMIATTVFILLLTGVYRQDATLSGIPLIQQSVAHQFGPFAIHIVSLAVCMFAFTSIVGNYYYAESNIRFITKSPVVMAVFRIAAAVMVFIGAQTSIGVAWSLADITMGLEAIVNIIAIVLLSRIAFAALRDYEEQKAKGLDPVFREGNIGLNDTEVWK